MKPETVLFLRKLAREAVIVALLGQLLATVVGFVRLDMDDRATAKDKAAQAVHAEMPKTMVPMFAPDGTVGEIPAERVNDAVKAGARLALVDVPLTNGTVLHVRPCETFDPDAFMAQRQKNVFDELAAQSTPPVTDCTHFSGPYEKLAAQHGGWLSGVALGSADQVAIEKNYWTAYKNSRDVGNSAVGSLFMGLWGFPAGLGLWIFYRLVRFAVKG